MLDLHKWEVKNINFVPDVTYSGTSDKVIDAAGKLIAKTHMDGHKFFVTGSGHSHTVAEEFYGRAEKISSRYLQ